MQKQHEPQSNMEALDVEAVELEAGAAGVGGTQSGPGASNSMRSS